MNHRWLKPSSEVRFSVTLSPTYTVSGGPGVERLVFVKPQPPARVPNNVIAVFAAAAGVEIAELARRAAAMPKATMNAVRGFDITRIDRKSVVEGKRVGDG